MKTQVTKYSCGHLGRTRTWVQGDAPTIVEVDEPCLRCADGKTAELVSV